MIKPGFLILLLAVYCPAVFLRKDAQKDILLQKDRMSLFSMIPLLV